MINATSFPDRNDISAVILFMVVRDDGLIRGVAEATTAIASATAGKRNLE
jgi:hypothetical protein